jgi:hypothetical protein
MPMEITSRGMFVYLWGHLGACVQMDGNKKKMSKRPVSDNFSTRSATCGVGLHGDAMAKSKTTKRFFRALPKGETILVPSMICTIIQ